MEPLAPPRHLKVGTIIDKTLGVAEHSAVAASIYVVGLGAMNAILTYYTLEVTAPMVRLGVGLVQFVVGISAAYLLLEAMLRATGLSTRTDKDTFFPYFALSILYTLGVLAGFLLIIIPGLLIMARWSIAQPMLVAQGEGVMKSLGESWERTSGNEFQIIGAALALLLLPTALIIACSILFEPANLAGIAVTQLATSATTVISLAMGVAVYGLIEGGRAASAFQ